MSIVINGTGSITGLSAGGLPDSSITSDDIAANAVTEAKLASGLYACKAWVNFNGTGTVAIRASGNVSSITDNGTADYTINFSNAMPDANYSISAICNSIDYNVGMVSSVVNQTTFNASTSSFRVLTWNVDRGTFDAAGVHVQVFR